MKKIKIIYFIHGSIIEGGASLSIYEIIKLISKNPLFEVHVFIPYGSNFNLIQNIKYYCSNVNFYEKKLFLFTGRFLIGWTNKNFIFNLLRVCKDFFYSLIYLKTIFREIDKINSNIIHFNSSIFLPFTFFLNKNHKIIVHNREGLRKNYFENIRFFFLKLISKNPNKIICISEIEKKQYKTLFNLNNLQTIHNPITNIFKFKKIKLKANHLIISCFGGYDFKKGTLDILSSIKDIDYPITLIICGPDEGMLEYRNSVNKLIEILNSRDNFQIIMIGPTDNPLNIIHQSDIVIVPHKFSHFSRVIIECFSLKKKVITYKDNYSDYLNQATQRTISTNQNNFLGLKEKIIEIIQKKDRVNLNSNYIYWKNNYHPRVSYNHILNLYLSLCQ